MRSRFHFNEGLQWGIFLALLLTAITIFIGMVHNIAPKSTPINSASSQATAPVETNHAQRLIWYMTNQFNFND